MSEIKTNFEFPRGEDNVKFMQRLIQDLSKNFKALKRINDTISSTSTTYGLDGVELSGSFTVTPLAAAQAIHASSTYTLTHNLGSIPRGFIVTDLTTPDPGLYGNVFCTVSRTSWTTTQITIRIDTIDLSATQTINGTYKILVLR